VDGDVFNGERYGSFIFSATTTIDIQSSERSRRNGRYGKKGVKGITLLMLNADQTYGSSKQIEARARTIF
jgi:hypothetical protein